MSARPVQRVTRPWWPSLTPGYLVMKYLPETCFSFAVGGPEVWIWISGELATRWTLQAASWWDIWAEHSRHFPTGKHWGYPRYQGIWNINDLKEMFITGHSEIEIENIRYHSISIISLVAVATSRKKKDLSIFCEIGTSLHAINLVHVYSI